MKKILFITPNSFRQVSGGSVLFGELFKTFKSNLICWFICGESLVKTTFNYKFKSIAFCNVIFFSSPFIDKIARHFAIFGIPYFFIKYKIVSRQCSKKAIDFINSEKLNFMWVYASDFSIPVAQQIHEKLKIPIHLSIQDDIYTHLALYQSKRLEKYFKYLLENADSIDFTSKEMGLYYKEKYNVRAKTITFLISQQIKLTKPVISNEVRNIGYAGTIWCKENFLFLLKGLKELDLEHSVFIRMHIFAQDFPKSYLEEFDKYIVFSPIVEYEKLMGELQACDLLYCPMSFLEKKMITNITSFPSKLLTYMNAEIPILNHSPIQAVSHKYVVNNSLGYSINSTDMKEICSYMLKISDISSRKQRQLYSENADIELRKFDTKTMTDNFISLLNVGYLKV